MGKVELVYVAGETAVATFERVLLTFVRGPITLEYLAEAHRVGRGLAKSFPGGIASLTLVPGGGAIPEKAVREQAKHNTRESGQWVRAAATVMGGEGFAAAVARSVLTAITAFESGPPRRVFGAAEPSITWLSNEVGVTAPLDPLVHWANLAMSKDYGTALRRAG